MTTTPIEILSAAPLGAAEAPVPHEVDPTSLYVVAHEFAEVIDLERFALDPRRPRGRFEFHTTASLVQYVQRHRLDGAELGGPGMPEVYADIDRVRIVAVLNVHEGETDAGWHDWIAAVTLRSTPEWKAWAKHDGELLDQVEFAEHLEDRLDDIVDPPAAELLEVARTFEAKRDVAFRSAIVVESGARQFTYNEQIEARAGAEGKVTVPSRFGLGLAPFEGSEAFRLEARLRYRITGGRLAIGYQLVRPDLVLRAAFLDAVLAVETGTGLVAHQGVHGTP